MILAVLRTFLRQPEALFGVVPAFPAAQAWQSYFRVSSAPVSQGPSEVWHSFKRAEGPCRGVRVGPLCLFPSSELPQTLGADPGLGSNCSPVPQSSKNLMLQECDQQSSPVPLCPVMQRQSSESLWPLRDVLWCLLIETSPSHKVEST